MKSRIYNSFRTRRAAENDSGASPRRPGGLRPTRASLRLALILPLCLLLNFAACAQYGGQQGFLGLLGAVGGSGASPIESITQVPSTIITGSPATVTISPVDMSRSFVLCNQTAGSSRPNNIVTCQLSATDQVVIETFDPNNQNVALSVVQFSSGAFVQRGSLTFGAATAVVDVPIVAVNLAQTFVLVASRINSNDTSLDQQRLVAPTFASAGTLRLARGATGNAINVEWQVVQLSGASVQSGTVTLSSGATSATVPVAPFDPATSFVVHHVNADASVLGRENSYYVRAVPDAGANVQFFRNQSTGSPGSTYFLVSMLDLSSVQRGAVAINAAYTNTPLLTAGLTVVDTTRSIVLSASDIVNPADTTRVDDQDSGQFRAALQSASVLEFQRGSAESPRTGTISWQVVQFQN